MDVNRFLPMGKPGSETIAGVWYEGVIQALKPKNTGRHVRIKPAMTTGVILMMIHGSIKICLSYLILLSTLSCYGPSLTEYVPLNEEEKKIMSLLIQYQDAKTNCNLEKFLACLHEKGKYQFGRGSMVSKIELKRLLPGFWSELQSGNPAFYPINREMMTGNYIRTGRFLKPQITINRDTAEITMTFTKLGWRLKHYISMFREDDQWLINRLAWDMN